jgi:dCTP deaminase
MAQIGDSDPHKSTAGKPVRNTQSADLKKSSTPPVNKGIWSAQRLRDRIIADNIVRDGEGTNQFDDSRLDPASFRLRMGAEVYVSPATETTRDTVRMLKEQEAFIIPPGQFGFLLTEEVVQIPADAMAFIALRSKKTKFRGLVNVSGFHADPGYTGRLIFAVFNAGPGDVHIRRGDELFSIFFADLDQQTEKPRSGTDGYYSIPADLISPVAGQIQSFAGLNDKIKSVEDDLEERLQKLERDNAILRWATALIVGALIAFTVRVTVWDPQTQNKVETTAVGKDQQ